MNEVHSEQEPLEQLAEAFLARYRAGERPAISEYTANYPELAKQIQELFPALIVMEANRPPARTGALFSSYVDATRIPEQLGEYRLLRQVGRGGMGVVYEAVQESLGRHVALKVLPFNPWVSPTHLERFRREARAAARLHHTHIVPVYGVGEDEGYHFYAMQFIHGQGLDAVLQEVKRLCAWVKAPAVPEPLVHILAASMVGGKIAGNQPPQNQPGRPVIPAPSLPAPATDSGSSSPSQTELTSQSETQYFRSVAGVGVQVAEALEYAHRHGILHRDIKPSNLLLDTAGQIWVTDFGLAKADDSEELTNPGDLVGTLRYLAPERLQGKADPRSDVYGLGTTLYEMLTLRPAFEDSDRALLLEHIRRQEPPPPQKLDRRIPKDLETIVLKAMAKEPGRRYQSAESLAEDLRRFLADRPIQARPASPRERAWRWCRRNPLVAGLIASLVGLVLLTAIASTTGVFWLNAERKRALTNLDRAERAEKERTKELCRSYLTHARAVRLTRLQGQRTQGLEAVQRVKDLLGSENLTHEQVRDLRNEAIACLALPDLRLGKHWEAWTPGTTAMAFDGSYRLYARGDGQGNITVRSVADDHENRNVSFPGKVSSLWLSPNGRFLAAWSSAQYRIWDLPGEAEPAVILEGESSPVTCAFSQDNWQIALAWRDGTVDVHDLVTGRTTRKLVTGVAATGMAWSPDGRRLALAHWPRPMDVQIWDVPSGRLWKQLPAGSECVHALAWHPAGTLLALGLGHPTYRAEIWDTGTGKRLAAMEGHTGDVDQLAIHPDGELLATGSWDGTTRFWDLWTGRLLLNWPGSAAPFRFSPDGRLLGCHRIGNQMALVEVELGSEYRTLVCRPSKKCYTSAAINPDGDFLAVASDDGVYVVPLRGNHEQHFLPVGLTYSVLFQRAPGSKSGTLEYDLWTCGPGGLRRWPYQPPQASHGTEKTAHLGPPQTLPLNLSGYPHTAHGARNGQILAVDLPLQQAGLILDLNTQTIRARLYPHPNLDHVALSPDGQWAASGGWHPTQVRIWNAHTGRLVKELPLPSPTRAFFTPDSRYLIVSQVGDYTFWKVGDWQPAGHLTWQGNTPGFLAFSPDQRMMALELAPGEISLVDWSSRGILAKLVDPHRDPAGWLSFSPDGSQLITVSQVIHIWDLAGLRRRLGHWGLDRGLPTLSSAENTRPPHYPRPALEVDLGNLPWELAAFPAEQNESRAGFYTFLLALNPWNYEAYSHRGRLFLEMGQIEKALADFELALLLCPPVPQRRAEILLARAEAFRRLGRLSAAIAELQQLIAQGPYTSGLARSGLADALLARGRADGALGRWHRAASDYAEAFALRRPEPPAAWFEQATLRLAVGDGAGYRRVCRLMRERLGESEDVDDIAFLAHACVLGPHAPEDKAAILKLAQRRFDRTPTPSRHHTWSVHVLGLGYYRAGRYDQAVAHLRSWLDADHEWDADVLNRLVLGMAYQKSGNDAQARRCLQQADALIRQKARLAAAEGKVVPPGWHWRDWLAVQLLRREFEALRRMPAQ